MDNTENMKIRILIPMVLAGTVLIVISLYGGYWLQKRAIEDSVYQRCSGVNRLFKEFLDEEAQIMSGQIDFLKTDQDLVASFLARDRSNLTNLTQPLLERMRLNYRITHFYFHEPDKVCFLRVHSPDRYGDLIDRFTITGAASSGQPFHGIELGPLGTFTLRVVHPWVTEGRLVGYIELGMEIEHLTQLIKQAQGVELLVLIEKRFLERDGWEAGLKILNREGNWDLFNDFVIIDQTISGSNILDEKLNLHLTADNSTFIVEFDNSYYMGIFEDLIDAGNRRVGEILILTDVSAQHADLNRLVLLMATISVIIGTVLFLFFNKYIGRIEDRLVSSRQELQTEIEVRRSSEEALTVSEKRFRSLFEESKDAIVTTDHKGNILMVNPAGRELLGLAEESVQLKKIQDLYVERTMAKKFAANILEHGFIRDFGVQLYGKGGRIIDCLMTVTSKISDSGVIAGFEGIIRDVTPYKKFEEELRRLATTDALTNANNRRSFIELAQKEIKRAKRYGHPLSVVMIDIDHFKKVNDSCGHSAGDRVLVELSKICMNTLRESDVFGRYGGEEFAMILVESNMEAAVVTAERIREAIASHKVVEGKMVINISVSLGVAELLPDDDLDSMLKRADIALYQAKENGRNQVQTAECYEL